MGWQNLLGRKVSCFIRAQKLMRRNYTSKLNQDPRYITALYLSGDKAKENYAVLTPFMEFDSKFKDDYLEKNISWRKSDINVVEIRRKYESYKRLKGEIPKLETRRQDIAIALRESEAGAVADVKGLKKEGKNVREKLKLLKEEFYPIEEDFITAYLDLPNDLHEKTPKENAEVFYRNKLSGSSEGGSCIHHLQHRDLIDFSSQSSYYLLKDAAAFEWEFPYFCIKHFLDHNFTLTINPDFGRSVLVEAALINKATIRKVTEEENQNKINPLYLTGGGSLIGFLGYIAKLSVFPSVIPLRLITSGRKYSESNDSSLEGLYTTLQTNTVQAFVATQNSEQAEDEIDSILNIAVDIYKKLDINFCIEFLPAHKLLKAESLRASIQIFSPVYQRYIEVGYLSLYTDFISKRLLFNIRNNKDIIFPNIISGTIFDVTKIIACLLENGKTLSVPHSSENKLQSIKDPTK